MILILRDSLIILFYLRHLSGCIQASVWWIAIIHAPLRGVGPSNRCQDVLRDVGTFLKCEGVLWPPSPGNRCVYYTYTVYIYIYVYIYHISLAIWLPWHQHDLYWQWFPVGFGIGRILLRYSSRCHWKAVKWRGAGSFGDGVAGSWETSWFQAAT